MIIMLKKDITFIYIDAYNKMEKSEANYMLMNDNIITRSIDLHLFFMRIMKEHMLFIEAAFTPQNFGMQAAAFQSFEE